MRKAKLFITYIFISWNFGFLQSQEYVLRFQNITTKQGLSDNRITDVLQDSNGLLWAATELAINKYNGEKTEVYHISRGCVVHQLLEDKAGNIWAATTKGLYIYNDKKNIFSQLKSTNKDFNKLLKGNILKLIQTKNGYWFICNTVLAGFKIDNNFNIVEKTQKMVANQEPFFYTSLIEDRNHIFWLGTNKGTIFSYDHKTIQKYELPNYTNNVSINDMVIDATHTLWVATNGNGLFRFHLQDGKMTHYLSQTPKGQTINNNIVLSLLVDHNDHIWIGTDGGGLNLYQKKLDSFHYFQQSFNNDSPIADNSILSIHQGLDNTVLLSTVHGGICIFKNDLDIKRISTDELGFNYKDGQSSTILEDSNKNIWLSAGREGLRKYNPLTKQLTTFIDDPKNQNDLSGDIILSLIEDKQKRIWIGTLRGGLNIYNTTNKTFLSIPNSKTIKGIYAIEKTEDGTIWVGFRGGVKIYDMDLNLIEQIQVSTKYSAGNAVTAIYKDVKGDMWVGSGSGLHRYQKTPTGFSKYSYYSKLEDTTTLGSNHILSIAETNDLSLLIGTYGYGVSKYSRTTDKFQRLKTKNNIDGSIIRGILKDQNQDIWFSTNTGLSKMNPDGAIINLTTNEGVQAFNGGASALSSDGSILMAGSQGLTYFYPQELQHNSPLPKVFFTSASIINKEKNSDPVDYNLTLNKAVVDTAIELTHNTILFSINFSSSYFYDPEELKYAYMLEGLNDSWQTIENTKSLTFSSLIPGDYTLKIKVANKLEIWSPHIASLKLKVIPSIWQRKSTKIAFLLIIIALIIFVFRRRMAAIKNQKEKLKQLLKIKSEEIIKQQDEVYQGKIAVLNAEKQNQELNQKKLEGELKFKINELTNNTLRTVHKNNLLNDIKEKLKKEIKQVEIDKQSLKNIISHIDDSFILDKDWKNFYSIFNQVHPNFIKDLKRYCTKLSERDMQLCALIKLDFSSQHIATLFGISLSSVKVARHRLRKKLNMQENHSLKDFLSDINAMDSL